MCRALSYDGLENAFAIAAINGGSHANPTFAGDTIYAITEVRDRWSLPGRSRRGRAAPAHHRRQEPRAGRADRADRARRQAAPQRGARPRLHC